nr:S8 family serine peptidase [Cohnella zeiphila]
MIGIPEAWAHLTHDVSGTIAVIDTGADLKNPRLTPYLTEGINLLDRTKPPLDDNGHGTAVAGVLAEIADAAKISRSGAAWRMKIMPIKALDAQAEGSEASLAEGIRYAVGHGADIVVLSLGLHRDSSDIRQAVAQAEREGVLLVAASGNDAAQFGTKAAVQYPAAYPTVLAVGGSNGTKADSRSTPGPELDVSAAWQVQTLKPGGGTVTMEGSSMSAPQAAGAAALLRAAKPQASPARLRDLLRGTAQDIGSAGWDSATGYGLIRADRAVEADENADWREPNDDRSHASVLPIGAEALGIWASPEDRDDYRIEVPADGSLTVSWQTASTAGAGSQPDLRLYAAGAEKMTPAAKNASSSRTWTVAKGSYILETQGGAGGQSYRLESAFRMAPDAMEPNQTALTAFTLGARTQQWTGTFDKQGDEDWFAVTLPREGKLSIRVDADTTRIDPALTVEREGEEAEETDDNGDGESEEVILPQASPGKYYIRIRNATAPDPVGVIGTYTARLEYIAPYEDRNEPNDGPLEATPLAAGAEGREGLIGTATDADWFRFALDESNLVRLQLAKIPKSVRATMTLYSKQLAEIGHWSTAAGAGTAGYRGRLDPGTYYVKLTADAPFRDSFYRLTLEQDPVSSLFLDIKGHWAESAIRALAEAGWVAGYGGRTFGPDRSVTRAEAVVMAVRARKPVANAGQPPYSDVPDGYWAHDAIAQAEGAHWLNGIGGIRFEPDRAMTRGEAALLLARAAKLTIPDAPKLRFADVPILSKPAGALDALVRKGWIGGYPDGTFRPNRPVTRAEWAAMLANLL